MADDRSKLEKFVGMLGSDHEGEQLNALRFIKKIAAEQKKTISELLLTGPERIVYRERVVYKESPQPPPYRRNYSGSFNEEPRQRKHSSRFEERDDGALGRELLDALTEAAENGGGVLSWSDLDAARSMAYSYNYDEDLSEAQVKYARSIIKRYKKGSTDSVV